MKADEAVLICAVSICGSQDGHHLAEGVALLHRAPVELPLEPRRVVVDVRDRDGHRRGGGERQRLPQVRGDDFKAVAGAGLVIHLAHRGDPAGFAVNGNDGTQSDGNTQGGGVEGEQRSKAVGDL